MADRRPRLTLDEARHVASLARITLEDEELVALAGQLDSVLEYVAELEGVDVEGVPPTVQAVRSDTELRPDEPAACLSHEDAVAGVTGRGGVEDGGFAVPRLLEVGG